MSQRDDPFAPRNDPAKTLYEAFQAEAKRRKGRRPEEWIAAERRAVWTAARDYAQAHGLTIPTMDQVTRAERYASGSVDYGAKWAYCLERLMKGASHAG